MTETILVCVIALLLLHNMFIQRSFLGQIKELTQKLAGIQPDVKVETPNDIKENTYRDIADVNPAEVIK